METKISRVNKVSILSLPLSLSLFSLSIEHLWAKTIDELSMRSQIWTVSRSMLTSGLTVHMLKCIVRGHVCCPLIHDSSFHSSFHFKSPQRLNEKKKTNKKKQCIANTIKNTIELPLHLTERAPHSNKEGGTPYSRAASFRFNAAEDYWFLTSKCEGHLRAVLFRLNAIECCVFRKSAYLFPTEIEGGALSSIYGFDSIQWFYYIWELYYICGFNRVQCMFCFKAHALILQLIIAIQL